MEQLEIAIAEIKEAMPGLELRENEPMSEHCSFRIGGPARVLAIPSDVIESFKDMLPAQKAQACPVHNRQRNEHPFPRRGLK